MRIFRGILVLAIVLVGGTAYADWRQMLDTAKGIVQTVKGPSADEEVEIGRQWAALLVGAAPLVHDEAKERYVNKVGRWLALHSERPDLNWKFGILDSPNINAFAMPGGYVLITRGLVERLHNEAELAGALAHEISHVVCKHQLKALKKSKAIGLGSEGLGKWAASKGQDPALTKNVIGGLKEVTLRGLDKDDEYQADRMGVVIAARSGYDPFGLAKVLQMLQSMNAQDSGLALLFATHPAPAARLDALEKSVGGQLDTYAEQPPFAERYLKVMAAP